jgi:class 3 adenylate cyclase
VIGAYHKCVAETVARFAGFVAKYMGDGVLIYFGYPQAHDDDAERAVRAGLALIEAVGKPRVQEALQVRIGVATGLVVVGDLIGSGEAQERGVVGETPNLAARQALAVGGRQCAKLSELQAAASLARLRRDKGKGTEARDLLAPIYGWFTEGFDTPVLQDAKALLERLGA